jgi:hypothetical protein
MVVETTEMAVQSAVIFSTLRRSPFGTFREHSARPFLPSNSSGKHPSTTEVLRIGSYYTLQLKLATMGGGLMANKAVEAVIPSILKIQPNKISRFLRQVKIVPALGYKSYKSSPSRGNIFISCPFLPPHLALPLNQLFFRSSK